MTGVRHLIVRVAGRRVALPAAGIEAVVEIDAVTPVPRAAPHVAGLAAQRSRLLTVIDGRAALGLATAPRTGPQPAVVLQWEGHGYALLVDSIEHAVELDACSAAAASDDHCAGAAPGPVDHDGEPLLVVSPALLAAGAGPSPSS